MDRNVAFEVLVQDLVEGGALGVPWAVEGRPVGDERKSEV
jgi:hypothetical protein